MLRPPMQHFIGFGPRGQDTYTEHELINLPFTWIENEAIWQFLWYRIHDARTRQIEKCCCDTKSMRVWEDFRSHTGSGRPLWKLKNYFQEELAPTLPTAFLAEDTKIELYFGLGLPVNMDFYSVIKKEGYIDLDSIGRISRFIADSGLHLATTHRYRAETEYEKMWEFLRRRIHSQSTGKVLHPTEMPCELSLWKEFKDAYPVVTRGVQALLKIYREEMAPKIHQTSFDLTTKAKLCFVLRIPVVEELFQGLLRIAVVNLNGLRRIVYYNEHASDLKLFYNEAVASDRKNNFQRSAFTEQEEIAMFTFVYHKVQDHKTKRIRRDKSILQSKELWMEFDRTNRVHREPATYMRRFKSIMLPVCYLAKISKMMKMALHFALEIPVPEDLLTELRSTAIVELNREGCIVAYKERKKRALSGNSESSEVIIDLENEPAPKIQKSEDTEPDVIALDDVVSETKYLKPEPNEPDLEIIAPDSTPKPASEINESEIDLLLQQDDANENLEDLIPEDELLLIENPESIKTEDPESTEDIQKEVEKLIDQMVSELDMEEQEMELFSQKSPNSPPDLEEQDLILSAPKPLENESELSEAPEPSEHVLESSETPESIESIENQVSAAPEFSLEKLSQDSSVTSSVNTVICLGPYPPESAPEDDDDEDSMSIIEIKEVVEEIIQKIEAQQ